MLIRPRNYQGHTINSIAAPWHQPDRLFMTLDKQLSVPVLDNDLFINGP